MWNGPSPAKSDNAYEQNTNELIYARVEVKDAITRETKVVAEVPACDYRLFKWEAEARMVGGRLLPGVITGIRLCGRYKEIIVYRNGVIKEEVTTDNYHYLQYGR
jgi:hypothetical protein